MNPDHELLVIFCTAPDEATAERLARGLVEERLAACVNQVPGLKSTYRWQESIESDTEIQLIIKTPLGRFDDVAAWIQSNHPYDVPEIVALPATRVSDAYLRWAIEETS